MKPRKSITKIVSTFILLFSITINAQTDNISVEFAKVFKNDTREIPTDIIGSDETGYYLLYAEGRFGTGKKSVRKFSPELLPTGQEIALEEGKSAKINSLGVNKVNDKIIHLWSIIDDQGKKYFYQTLDLKSFSLGKTKFIAEIKNDTKKAANSLSRFLVSEDEKTITLFYTIPNKNKELQKIRVQKFDANFNELESKEYEFEYQNKLLAIHNILLDKNEKLVIICKKYNSLRVVKEELSHSYEFQVYKIQNGELNLVNKIIPKDIHLRYLEPIIDANNNLLLSGLFAKNSLYAMTGVFASKIELNTGEKGYETYNNFDADFFTSLIEEGKKKGRILKRIEKGKYEDQNYILRDAFLNKNGEQVIIAEQTHTYSYNYSITYYHQNLAVIKLNDKGEIIWANKIGKNQTKPNVPIYSSYFPVPKKDKFYLLYNCHINNLERTKGNIINPFLMREGRIFTATEINNDGKYKRIKLADKEQLNGITIRPLLYNWVDDNTLLMFGQDIDNLKNQGFVKIKFN